MKRAFIVCICVFVAFTAFANDEYIEIATWEGKSIKNTETFTVTEKEWIIQWATKPGEYGEMNFQIYIYKADGTLIGVAANIIGEGSDYSVMRGRGSYYLMINSAQPYVIKILMKK